MLVLTRKKGEEIQIGDSITVKVSEVNGNRVKICIDAPEEIRIVRGEVVERNAPAPKPQQQVILPTGRRTTRHATQSAAH